MKPAIAATLLALGMPLAQAGAPPAIPGYTHGQPGLASAPYALDDLAALRRTLLLGEEDVAHLRRSKAILAPQVEAILDVWYGFVASTPELLVYFSDRATGAPDGAYLDAVRRRFAQWILDTADARFDQDWLDYQYEIGRRHHLLAKNRTDGVDSVPIIHFRYLVALTIPVTTTLKPFLAKGGDSPEVVDAMHAAWVKSVLLQVILWSHPYIHEGQF
jgi:hypothetical protein